MIKIKAKFDKNTNDFNIKYTCKNTFTAEALCTIEFICQEILDKDRLLLILGMPGIGKTMISKMLVLYYAQKGYSIRYSNSRNLDDLKKY